MAGLKIEQVATMLGVSAQTLNRWYKFKKQNPNDEISVLLPDYTKVKTTRGWVRIWQPETLWALTQVKSTIRSGRTGQMGKYHGKGTKNGKSKNSGATNTTA